MNPFRGLSLKFLQNTHHFARFPEKNPYICRMKIAIIGGGAAGCFCAVNLRRLLPEALIDLYESGQKPLQKVAITGGGRCNLTNSFNDVKNLQQVYPRGANLMKHLFRSFDHQDTMEWFENEGVRLIIQEDECVFPQSQDAMEIVSTLLRGMQGVHILCNQRVLAIEGKRVSTANRSDLYDAIVVTTGGSPKASGLDFLAPLHLEVIPPVPSLFTFNINSPITELMGTVVEQATTSLAGTKFKAQGPLLITHWGMSGPAILKLSSHASRWLAEHQYQANLCVNWMGDGKENDVHEALEKMIKDNPKKQIASVRPVTASGDLLSQRLWNFLLKELDIAPERRCSEIGSKQLNRMAAKLTNATYRISGQSRFKEEFVTCGGIALSNIDPSTMECRNHPGIYFAGEVLDVDAVTGGFNLQAAWSMGWQVAKSIAAIGLNDM